MRLGLLHNRARQHYTRRDEAGAGSLRDEAGAGGSGREPEEGGGWGCKIAWHTLRKHVRHVSSGWRVGGSEWTPPLCGPLLPTTPYTGRAPYR